ncbi:hypothetical protein A6M27_11385 [Acidithiobacillus thiooxidans]|uniref:Uncharacterized protein n=1 Tax=Acidithiobacillus thiooxidans TaxID=930 RepID=A0A1C2JFB9_ACITH|nr:hypothetical protein [Acidithiobacillus thiooxidans]OCX70763.1 hypothetical protein A6O24_16145 [Acidithiobacillus thiooxidans]OCX71697.1 hypothetical protein A6P07_11495 [Acidithiobacillus thiooxidans]OCX77801.1 hypothetical protein A6O26_19255 [Acidithiobacillus thiooxidans]OCX86896.1 hypothetical protein A6M27_11385 [Acidithiobacillus thiooxidans]OFC49641.1 hypothetical protein BAE47_04775 [Acidithiobacillus thiooxidans]
MGIEIEALESKKTASETALSVEDFLNHIADYPDEDEEDGIGYTKYQEVSIKFKDKTYVVFYEDGWVNPNETDDDTIALAREMQKHDGVLDEEEDYDNSVLGNYDYIKKICDFLSESDFDDLETNR